MIEEEQTGVIKRAPMELATYEDVKAQVQKLDKFYRELMTRETDYGVVPGTDKPALYKAGAEMLRLWAGLVPHFDIDPCDTDRREGYFFYEVTCKLYTVDKLTGFEVYVGEGFGSCTSYETKYRYRWVYRSQVPMEMDVDTLASKTFEGKSGPYTKYRLDNENLCDLGNTILKMAKKRAFIDAILTVTGASRIFTQDIEAEEDEEGPAGKPEVEQPQAKSKKKPASSKQSSDSAPDVMSPTDFWKKAREITGLKNGDEIAAKLGVPNMEKWTGTLEEAIELLEKGMQE